MRQIQSSKGKGGKREKFSDGKGVEKIQDGTLSKGIEFGQFVAKGGRTS